MADNDGQERTEQATGKRVEKARDQGQIARSRELSTMLLVMGMAWALVVTGNGIVRGLMETMTGMFSLAASPEFPTLSLSQTFIGVLLDTLLDLAPLLAAAFVLSLVAPLAVGGWNWSFQAMGFKWERMSPLAGFGRLFSTHSLVELAKSWLKLMLFTMALLLVLWKYMGEIDGLQRMDGLQGFTAAMQLTSHSFFLLAALTVLIALIDVPWQLYSHAKRLRMTKQEIRDEAKESEGSPEVKGKIRRMQMEVAMRRMMEDVPKADVIVTNPTHYAVALRYDTKVSAAPILVAKGADEVAMHIIRIGTHHKVMTFAAPPLARAIYHSTKIGAEIPAGLYVAVARVLAYVLQLRSRPQGSQVVAPKDLPIPDELRRD
jgi:flagellar biosynthesis protein FlhB